MWGDAQATPFTMPPGRQPRPAWIQLLRYTPGFGAARAIGAVWRDGARLHWASPLARRFEGLFDPLPFMLCFPDAQPECAQFERGLEWLDAECFAASDPQQVRDSCAANPEWHLSCQAYPGSDNGPDLAALLAMAPHWQTLRPEHLRGAVTESVAHLAGRHQSLHDTPLEPVHDDTMEACRLHLSEGRRVRIVVHPSGGRGDVTRLALQADKRLQRHGDPGDTALLVLPQLGSSRPLRVTLRVTAVPLVFSVIARALLDAHASIGRTA